MLRMNSRAYKTGALPAELHARGPSVPTNSHDEPVFGDPGATYSKCITRGTFLTATSRTPEQEITTLEFFQHHFSQMGHREFLLVAQNLSQPTSNHCSVSLTRSVRRRAATS